MPVREHRQVQQGGRLKFFVSKTTVIRNLDLHLLQVADRAQKFGERTSEDGMSVH